MSTNVTWLERYCHHSRMTLTNGDWHVLRLTFKDKKQNFKFERILKSINVLREIQTNYKEIQVYDLIFHNISASFTSAKIADLKNIWDGERWLIKRKENKKSWLLKVYLQGWCTEKDWSGTERRKDEEIDSQTTPTDEKPPRSQTKQTLFYYDRSKRSWASQTQENIDSQRACCGYQPIKSSEWQKLSNNVSKHTKSAVCKLQYFHRKPARQVLQLKKTDWNSTFSRRHRRRSIAAYLSFQKTSLWVYKDTFAQKELANSIFDGKKVGYAT